jgi:DNA-binding LacI/PurR family transcriptional regulator
VIAKRSGQFDSSLNTLETTMPNTNVMSIGLHPDVVNYALFPGLTHEKLSHALKAQAEYLEKQGFNVTMCLVDLGQTAEQTARAALLEKQYDVVVIGAGVRTPPPHLILFEKLINVVHECAPKAKICFNTTADDTAEAILRWAKPA